MNRTPVKSSQIASIGHDPVAHRLEVEFRNGDVYHYHDVSVEQHHALVNSPSVGKHFHAQIRGKHRHEKITTPSPKQ